ncbi:hypothetical protein [Serratia marcescens]|uniref:hypothetical protein n=1 Tax=Serratia marcescens TaxID=615 RepID=UPI003D01AAD7
MQVSVTLPAHQWKALQQELKAAELPPKKRQRLLWRILKLGVMVAARRHQRRQENAEGVKWPGRADGRKDKMMRELVKMMAVQELPASESARIYLKGAKKVPPGVVGAVQSTGFTTQMSAERAANASRKRDDGATLRQAKRLFDLGYTVFPVSAPRKPSLTEIMESLSMQKAGAIIRSLEGRPPKSGWTITLPGREWLAVSDDEFNKILARQMQAINFGWKVRAQDVKGKVTK